MSNELPTLYQEIYYIYFHVIPETEEIVYIGKGSRGRAWHCAESNLGYSYDSIGKEISVSTMTIYRALNGITKNYGI